MPGEYEVMSMSESDGQCPEAVTVVFEWFLGFKSGIQLCVLNLFPPCLSLLVFKEWAEVLSCVISCYF